MKEVAQPYLKELLRFVSFRMDKMEEIAKQVCRCDFNHLVHVTGFLIAADCVKCSQCPHSVRAIWHA